VSVGIQWNSFALISSLFSQEKIFFPENGSPGNLFLSLVEEFYALWTPVIQVKVVVNAQWLHGYHISPIPNS
jgi:hypothetical protein